MNELLSKMELYAKHNNIPIMEKAGIEFMCDFIKRHDIRYILEIGSAIGYSAIRMCMNHPDIKVVTIERDETRYNEAIKNIREAGLEKRITLILGDALEWNTNEWFDLIFIDAAKAQYTKFFERYQNNLKKGGYIISDNLGFHGMVADHNKIKSRNMRQLIRKLEDYHDFLKNNPRFKTTFYEVGDIVGISQHVFLDIQGVIFDMDGLLVDSERITSSIWNEYANTLGFSFDDGYFKSIIGTTKPNIEIEFNNYVKKQLNFNDFYDQVHRIVWEYYEKNGVPLKAGVRELINYLDDMGIKKIVATSSHINDTTKKLKLAGIYENFDKIISGDMIKHSKPNPEIFLKAQVELKLPKGNLIVLEDSINGVYAGLNAGIRVIMVPDMLEPNDKIKQEAFMIKSSLIDVLDYLKESKK